MPASRTNPSAAAADAGLRAELATRVRAFGAALSRRLPNFRGKERAVRAFEACLRSIAPSLPLLRVTVDGVTYALQTEDINDYRVAYLSENAGAVVRYVDRIIVGRSAVFWDVGANVGTVSLPLARRHADLSIEAFEPSPPVIARLRRNLALNGDAAARIRLHEAALCDRIGSVDFYPSAESENSGVGTLMATTNTLTAPVRVAAHTGDALIAAAAARPPDVIKIDVEGFEYEVLCGLRQYLTERRDLVVVFEHEPYRLRDRTESPSPIELLTSLGFKVFGLTRRAEIQPLGAAMLDKHIDLVACGRAATQRIHEGQQ